MSQAAVPRPVLTSMEYPGYSRDDIGTFLPTYLGGGILRSDPFQARPSPSQLPFSAVWFSLCLLSLYSRLLFQPR